MRLRPFLRLRILIHRRDYEDRDRPFERYSPRLAYVLEFCAGQTAEDGRWRRGGWFPAILPSEVGGEEFELLAYAEAEEMGDVGGYGGSDGDVERQVNPAGQYTWRLAEEYEGRS